MFKVVCEVASVNLSDGTDAQTDALIYKRHAKPAIVIDNRYCIYFEIVT